MSLEDGHSEDINDIEITLSQDYGLVDLEYHDDVECEGTFIYCFMLRKDIL